MTERTCIHGHPAGYLGCPCGERFAPASSGDGGAPTRGGYSLAVEAERNATEADWEPVSGWSDVLPAAPSPVSEEGPPEFDGLALVEAVERAARFAMKDTALGSPALVKLVAGFIGEEVQEMLRHRIVLPQPPAGDGPLCWLPEGRWVRGMSPKEWIDATPEPPETPTPLWVLPGSTRPAATPEQGEGPAK